MAAFGLLDHAAAAPAPSAAFAALPPAAREQMLTQYCAGCHNDKTLTAGMSVQGLHADNLGPGDATWEKILRKLSLGEMPPKGLPAPPKEQVADFTHWLVASLDANAAAHPDPGRAPLRRLNRAEYANAVRDLLDLKIDVSSALPADDTGYGFDNIAELLSVSPTLMASYIKVAGRVGRTATGLVSRSPVTSDYRIPGDPFVNARANDELPLDSRGGGVFKFYAPYDAGYNLVVALNQGGGSSPRLTALNRFETRVTLKAGLHSIGASFPKTLSLEESLTPVTAPPRGPKPAGAMLTLALNLTVDDVRVKQFMVPAYAAGVTDTGADSDQVVYAREVQRISVVGPYDIKGAGDTPSRRKIFTCRPSASLPEAACARAILGRLAHQAYRRPATAADMTPLMKMYAEGRQGADFEHGVEAAIELILVSPDFIFVHEASPAGSAPGSVHPLSDLELATRLSLFLWSSIPDARLLAVAERNKLHNPTTLKSQITRMLADPKAQALEDNFAGQWLYLRRLEFQKPDKNAYPDFDARLRDAMLTETGMFFNSIVRENRSVLDFIDADYTYLNQRLAEHYGIPGVRGTAFRRVTLDPKLHRGGLLGQGSILTVTSYNNRTSVVQRGKWILDNLLAAPPPAPPPNVPSLDDVKNARTMTVREQMEQHRANPVCASCHAKMDPLGFSLENFDATGAWRDSYAGKPVDASAMLPDGTTFDGPAGLKNILLARKEQFVEAFTERLMIYALGRGVEAQDRPAIRAIRAQAARDNYRIAAIVTGIVQSVPFAMRKMPES